MSPLSRMDSHCGQRGRAGRDTVWRFTSCTPAALSLPVLGRSSGTAATSSYAKLDVGAFFNHGHELCLTDNGVVLSCNDVAPMYLTYHYRVTTVLLTR